MARGTPRSPRKPAKEKRITRYEHSDASDPRTPETGHTSLIGDEEVVTLAMDGWTRGARLAESTVDGETQRLIADLDPAVDPILFWAGKRTHREIPVLPLQRNEIVSESRIARIVDRARSAGGEEEQHQLFFAEVEKSVRDIDRAKRIDFYTHDEEWKNKLICGDSLQVMESLLHYEGLRGRVQMIYVDPPYGVDYNSNFQQRVDSAKNDEKARADDVLTIKAFRDTWALGVHSYLSNLHERFYLCRDLLAESGSIFVQMGMENGHLVKTVLDEVFGKSNRIADIRFIKAAGRGSGYLDSLFDQLLWYAKDRSALKGAHSPIYVPKGDVADDPLYKYVEKDDGSVETLTAAQLVDEEPIPKGRRFRLDPLVSEGETEQGSEPFEFQGSTFKPPAGRHWGLKKEGLESLAQKNRLHAFGIQLRYKRYPEDSKWRRISDVWLDTQKGTFTGKRRFAVQTAQKVVERCIAMTTKPGDLVLDITGGSGTTALAAEELGRRWILCDVSRVAVHVARLQLLEYTFGGHKLRGSRVSEGFEYQRATRLQPSDVAYEREPESVPLVDRPVRDTSVVRVVGPFEILTLGRYSVEDWRGYLVRGEQEGVEDYIEAVCRLYRKDVGLPNLGGLVHGVIEEEGVGISVGPISGRVTAKQIHEAVADAKKLDLRSLHVLGWAFEPNVGEVKKAFESEQSISIELVVIRPDTLVEGLKATQPEMLFSPLALPDVELEERGDGTYVIALSGVAVFDRKSRVTKYMPAHGGYVAAWYVDEDYDGDCFVDCQMFFDFRKKPAIERTLNIEVDPEEWGLQLASEPFRAGTYRRVAVKVVDVFGNESTVVKEVSV